MNVAFWRKWHRWIAWPAASFLLYASITGVTLAITERFGDAEAAREAAREDISPMKVGATSDEWMVALQRALVAAQDSANGAPLDRVDVQFKGDLPAIHLYTGKPGGGEDKKLTLDIKSGKLLAIEEYRDKPFLNRLHSGEALGDGGLMVAILWGASLAVITVTGLVIYLLMRRPGAVGIKRVFW